MKALKKIAQVLLLLLAGRADEESINLGLVDYSGQGRDEFGR